LEAEELLVFRHERRAQSGIEPFRYCVRVDAGGKDTADRTRTAVRNRKLTARGRAVDQRISVGVPAAKTVLGEIAEWPEVFAVEGDPALGLFGVASLECRPLPGLNPWIELIFHSSLLLFEQCQPGLKTLELNLR